jgi:hypothetical protein
LISTLNKSWCQAGIALFGKLRSGLAARGESTIGRAHRYCGQAQGARRRRCGDIVDDEQRSDRRATPMRPLGSGDAWASAALPLLDDGTTSPASRPLLILGQALSQFTAMLILPGPASVDGPAGGRALRGRSRPPLRPVWVGMEGTKKPRDTTVSGVSKQSQFFWGERPHPLRFTSHHAD